MNGITFKGLNLFKSSTNPPGKTPKKASPPPRKKIRWKDLVANPFFYMVPAVLILSYLLTYVPSSSLPVPEKGEIATSDIVAPVGMTIEDKDTTEARRREAGDSVPPVYSFDPNVFLTREELVREFFTLGRVSFQENSNAQTIADFQRDIENNFGFILPPKDLNYLLRNDFSPNLEENLINLLSRILDEGILASRSLLSRGEEEKGILFFRDAGSEKTIRITDLMDLKEGKEELSREIKSLDIPQGDRDVLEILSQAFLTNNVRYDPTRTQEKKELAEAGVETIYFNIKKGKVLVRKGDEVDEATSKLIRVVNQNLKEKPAWLINYAGMFILITLLFVSCWYYLSSLHDQQTALKYYQMMIVMLILSMLLYKLSGYLAETFSSTSGWPFLQVESSYWYSIPIQLGVLIFAYLTTGPVALIYTVLNSLLVGYLFGANFHLMVFSLVGGIAAIYGIKLYGNHKLTSLFRAGVFILAPINILVILTTHLIKERMGGLDVFTGEILMGVIGGLLSAALALLCLPVFETGFMFLTENKLLEFTNSDLPIFKRMAIEAPGSYHHSLIVASIAEEAAREINLNPQLVKAGAMYHDIGKIKRPEYFIENRTRNADMHKDLKPSMSSLVIINHVKEGVELAKKLKGPLKIREIIEQHHGTSLVRYFFEKAKEKYDPDMQKVGEESYRYPGPVPKGREAALIMMADSIEAASRSLKAPSETNLKRLITDMFSNHMEDGQLDECDFSLKELRAIAASFLSTLFTIYHPRIEYPGFDFEMKSAAKKNKGKTVNDRNNKQPKTILDQKK
ncbi:MAG: HDIG domain-containing protein [Candidatus Aminicenantes bacterium]|nr:HDIG domain-containing protein [Candidatus Aminicenantes bacterium]